MLILLVQSAMHDRRPWKRSMELLTLRSSESSVLMFRRQNSIWQDGLVIQNCAQLQGTQEEKGQSRIFRKGTVCEENKLIDATSSAL